MYLNEGKFIRDFAWEIDLIEVVKHKRYDSLIWLSVPSMLKFLANFSFMQVQWVHRFESIQKHFVKISATHAIAFAKDVALSELAVDTVPRDIRLNILKRILKYVRQQKVLEEKQAESSGYVQYSLKYVHS